jgi:hypothetical protein
MLRVRSKLVGKLYGLLSQEREKIRWYVVVPNIQGVKKLLGRDVANVGIQVSLLISTA